MTYLSRAIFLGTVLFATNCYAAQSESLSKEQLAELYPTLKEIYDDCKAAVAIADKGDLKGFMSTKCAMQINGFINGITLFTPQPIAFENNDLCKNVKKSIYDSLTHTICLDEEVFSKKALPELLIARRVTSYLEETDETNGGVSIKDLIKNNKHPINSAPILDMYWILKELYNCKPQQKVN